ncbi:hypothetical protein OF83DRAFT_862760 [Amylostereum chailletii]|nr:hypothetical protein OF83DRAFT_862760 [Amylostereum chailletii]
MPKGFRRKCFACGKVGHVVSTCPTRSFCSACYSMGHLPADCPKTRERHSRGVTCILCGEAHHVTAACLTNAKRRHRARQRPRSQAASPQPEPTARSNESPRKPAEKPTEPQTKPQQPPRSKPECSQESRMRKASKYKSLGDGAYKAGMYEVALNWYTQSIEWNDAHAVTFSNRAGAYIHLKRYKLALQDLQRAITLQDGRPSHKVLGRVGRCQYALGQVTPALVALREALLLQPDHAIAAFFKQKTLKLQSHIHDFKGAKTRNHWRMAHQALEDCIQLIQEEEGEIPIEWKCWGIELRIARREWDKGLDDAEYALSALCNVAGRLTTHRKALQAHKLSPDLMVLQATLMFLTGKLVDSVTELRTTLRMDPDNTQAKTLRGRVKAIEQLKKQGNLLYATSEWADAIAKYDECLKVIGEKPEEGQGGLIRVILLSNRGSAYVKLGRYREAMADAIIALSICPTWSKTLRMRSRVHIYNENYDAAVNDLELAHDNAPTEAERRVLNHDLLQAKQLAEGKRNEKRDHYQVLGVSRTCTKVELKQAYMRESRKHHPDKGGNEERFKLVAIAYEVLSDPVERRLYDLRNPM